MTGKAQNDAAGLEQFASSQRPSISLGAVVAVAGESEPLSAQSF